MPTPRRTGVPEDRIRRLNEQPDRKGRYVLYWMQQAQRAAANPALEYAIREADRRELGVCVVFGLTPTYPEATLRAYAFMIAGLRETQAELERRGIRFSAVLGDPPDVALQAARDAALLVCDRGYLEHQRRWRRTVAEQAPCPVVEVETDAVVPIETVTGKAEYAARTIRPKIHRHLDAQPTPAKPRRPKHPPPRLPNGLRPYDMARFPEGVTLDTSVLPVDKHFRGGTREARKKLARFLTQALPRYVRDGKHPDRPAVSELAPYLHFGQISPLEIMTRVRKDAPDDENRAAFLEQLCVRRELANNFAAFGDGYDRYETAVPEWARKTLAKHAADPRAHRYTRRELEAAKTHDPYWNAMMRCMKETGYLHNHLRMYWGKKVLEWSATPEEAFDTLLRINNRWFLDGRDPNSYAGVAWIFGRHDRPWSNRPIYGMVRTMTAAGLERAFDVKTWSQNQHVLRSPPYPARLNT